MCNEYALNLISVVSSTAHGSHKKKTKFFASLTVGLRLFKLFVEAFN